MEPTVLSGPLGHTQWEPDQPFPLGFHTLDSDNGGVLCQNKSDQTGLDFRDSDQDQASLQSEEDEVFQDKPVELDNLINISDFTCGDFQFEADQSINSKASLHSAHLEEFSYTEKTEGPDEISDCTLSWLFPPNLSDVVGKTFACEELNLTQEAPFEDSDGLGSQAELISLSVPVSPSKVPIRNSEVNTRDPFILVDLLSNDSPCLPPESSGEFSPQGVSEELVDLSQEEQAGLRETLSPETGDKGLFPDQVTELPVTSSTALEGLPENCPSQTHISTPLECFEGSVPLLDLEVPDCDSSLSLCPASPASVICTGALLHLSTEESAVEQEGAPAVIRNLTSEEEGENDSFSLGLSAETSSLTVPVGEDAFVEGGFTSESHSVENASQDLMEEKICSEADSQGNEAEAMALDLCLTADEVHDEETWDLKPQESAQGGSVPDPPAEQGEEETVTCTNQLEESDCREDFDFSVQDLNTSSPEAGWTSEQTGETISLSKMVVDDSLPMVSAVNTREEDVSPLKAVFDALDQDGDGFVRIEEFMEFAAAYGADQVSSPCFSC